jgi:SulP family sulfate permease
MFTAAASAFRRTIDDGLAGLPRELSAGFVAALSALTNCFALGALIFSGPLHPFLSQGIAASLLTCGVTAFIIALTSHFRIAIAAPTAGISALLAALMASLAPAMKGLPPEQILALAYAALFTATTAVAVTLLLLGFIRAGKLVRFVPYPVIAGFMGATGWFVIAGAVKMATDVSVDLASLPNFTHPREGLLLGILLVWAAVLWVLTKKIKHPLTLPVALILASLATDLALPLLGISGEDARQQGILFSMSDASWSGIPALNGTYLHADWLALSASGVIGTIGAVVLVAVLQTLSLATGLEIATRTEADLDHELRSMGWANAASAALGGFVGQIALSATTVNRSVGGTSRITGVVVSLVALLAMLGVGTALEYTPRFVLGGALLVQGARLMQEWAVATYRTLPRLEWLLVVAMIVITAWLGFVTAEVGALLAACVLFAMSVSRAGVVRAISGLNARTSALVRPEAEMLLLAKHGSAVQVIELRGFVFFGSTHELRETVNTILSGRKPLMLIFDFSKVVGIDSSAATAMAGISRLLRDKNVQRRIVGLSPAVGSVFRESGEFEKDGVVPIGVDEALEQGEQVVLSGQAAGSSENLSFSDWMSSLLGSDESAAIVRQHLVAARYKSGDYLCRRGDPTNDLYLIETGRLSAIVEDDNAPPMRVRAFGANIIVGEISFMLNVPRTASLRVDEDAIVWSLSRRAYRELVTTNPDVMLALLQSMLRLQVERLSFATRRIADLQA